MVEGMEGVPVEAAGQAGRRWRGWLLGNRTSPGACRWGLVPLRLMVGVIFFVHGSQKAFGWFGGSGFDGTVQMLSGLGFPVSQLFAVLLIAGELGGGVLLLLGVAPRLSALAIATVMTVALLTAHRHDGFFRTHLQQMLLAACVTIMVAGGGALSLLRSRRAEGE